MGWIQPAFAMVKKRKEEEGSPLTIKRSEMGIMGPAWKKPCVMGGCNKEGNWLKLSKKTNWNQHSVLNSKYP